MYSTVPIQVVRIVECSIRALFASILARHTIVHCAFVQIHVPLVCELLLASINIAREWLVECVRYAVRLNTIFSSESSFAQVARKRLLARMNATVSVQI